MENQVLTTWETLVSFCSFQERGAGSERVDRDRPLGVLFTGFFFVVQGWGPMELLNWQDVTLKKGQRDCSHSSSPSIFLTTQCISWPQTPGMFYHIYADVKLCLHLTPPCPKFPLSSGCVCNVMLPVMVSASLKADTRSTYSSSSLFNTSPGSWSQAGWVKECFGGGAEEWVHAGDVFGSSLTPSSYSFKRRWAMSAPLDSAKVGVYTLDWK